MHTLEEVHLIHSLTFTAHPIARRRHKLQRRVRTEPPGHPRRPKTQRALLAIILSFTLRLGVAIQISGLVDVRQGGAGGWISLLKVGLGDAALWITVSKIEPGFAGPSNPVTDVHMHIYRRIHRTRS
jgi:hypothetical protein